MKKVKNTLSPEEKKNQKLEQEMLTYLQYVYENSDYLSKTGISKPINASKIKTELQQQTVLREM